MALAPSFWAKTFGVLTDRFGVTIHGHPEDADSYVQGDRTLRTVRCRTCGIATHWEPLVPNADNRHGVNLINFDPSLLAQVKVRYFDGTDTWTFPDEGAG